MKIDSVSHLRNDYTATAYVINRDRTKMLMVFHKKRQKYHPPGGHIENNELPHLASLRETFEETGLQGKIVDNSVDLQIDNGSETQIPTPYCILYERIPSSSKDVEHMHVDFSYIVMADEEITNGNVEEVDQVVWMTKEELLACDTYESVKTIANRILKNISLL